MATTTNFLQTVQKIGQDIKADRVKINGNAADLSALATTAKDNLVNAINEALSVANQAKTRANAGVAIDDSKVASNTTWSSSKIISENSLDMASLGGPDRLTGTYKNIATLSIAVDLLNNTTIPNLSTSLAGSIKFVDYSQNQTLTQAQKDTACANIGAISLALFGDPATDFLAAFNAALV